MSQKRTNSKPASNAESKFKLKNGLDVRLIPSSKSPVVSVQMWVKTGSADERKAEEGISHFIEHLVFKGTKNFGVGEIARTVEASGGELNAWTSFDQTVFYVNISREFTETALDVISEMMGSPLFDAKEIDAEREVVLEEIKRTNDSPSRKGSRLLFSSLYAKHPYRLPVIGRPEVVSGVSTKVLRRYFQERYSAKNMVLVIGGDFETKAMKKLVADRYSALPGSRVRAVKRAIEPARTKPKHKVVVEKTEVQELQLFMAWPVPSAKHKDIAALETLSTIFGQGDASRLVRTLRIDSDCVTSIGAGAFAPKDRGFFSVSAHLNPTRLTEALHLIKKELVGLLLSPIDSEEIQRAITNVESAEFYGLETAEGLARKTGSLTTLLGDPSEFKKYLERVRGFTSEQARTITKQYFSPEKMQIVALAPNTSDEGALTKELTKFSEDLQKEWTAALKAKPAKKTKKKAGKKAGKKTAKTKNTWKPGVDVDIEIERRTLSSGLRVIARRTKSTPVVSARVGFLGGSRLEAGGQEGLTELLSRTWIAGTKDLSEIQLLSKIENMAAGIGAFGGRHTAGVSAQMLTMSEKEICSLFMDTTFTPKLTDEIVLREKTMMLESLRTRADRPGQIAGRMFMETMFANHAYASDPMGTEKSLGTLKRSAVEELQQRMITPKDGIFVLTGDADLDLWCDAIEKATAPFAKNRTTFAKQPYRWDGKDEVRKFHEIKKEQTQILIGWGAITLDDPRRYALQIAQAVLAGQGGRLFIELRDKKSLAYSVGPMSMEGVDSGYFGASIGCAPEKGETAIRMLREEFQKLVDVVIPDIEMDRAVRYLIGSHDLGLQKAAAVSSTILFNEIYGLPAEEVFTYADSLRAVKAADVRKLISDIMSRPPVLVAVGPSKPWK
ncbi:pitrilysin family protein [soil metagenome]